MLDIRMFWKNTVRLMDRVVMLENSCIIPCKDGLPKITLNITNGRISENSTEMVPFQRICESSGTLHLARQVLRRMEVFCQEHVISWAEVDIAETLRLMDETHLTCRQHLNESKIRNCFANKDQIEGILDFSGHRYAGQRGRERAAIKIQATWLMYRTKAHFNLVEPRLRALGVFFKRWASKKKNALMRQCIAYLKQFHMKRAAKLQTEMPKRIQSLANNEYAVIHIPSYGKDEKFEEFLHFAR